MRFAVFSETKKKPISFFVVLYVLAAFIVGIHTVDTGNTARQREYLERAITQDIIYCYASTGCYPDTLETLETAYGLTYDKNKFYIDYRVIGKNIYPQVTILER